MGVSGMKSNVSEGLFNILASYTGTSKLTEDDIVLLEVGLHA
jgi:hypothetical protein